MSGEYGNMDGNDGKRDHEARREFRPPRVGWVLWIFSGGLGVVVGELLYKVGRLKGRGLRPPGT